MPVIVDTCVWSLALRRHAGALSAHEMILIATLAKLIDHGTAAMLGPVRQELLSGMRESAQCERLRQHLRAFPHPALGRDDYEQAALASNTCRAKGLAGGSVDFLICGVSLRRHWPILTVDADFQRYASTLPLRLLQPK